MALSQDHAVRGESGAIWATTLAGAAVGAVATFPFPAVGGVVGALVATAAGAALGAVVGQSLKASRVRHEGEDHPSNHA